MSEQARKMADLEQNAGLFSKPVDIFAGLLPQSRGDNSSERTLQVMSS
jgi:hypothetical protein